MPTSDRSLNNALQLTLDALAEQGDGRLVFDAEHRDGFGQGAIDALIEVGLARPHPAASSVVCPGCEEACLMPVEQQEAASGISVFVVCDKPQDLGRIPIDARRLDRWIVDIVTLANCVSGLVAAPVDPHFQSPGKVAALGRANVGSPRPTYFSSSATRRECPPTSWRAKRLDH